MLATDHNAKGHPFEESDMRTEQEVVGFRNGLYQAAVMMRQQQEPTATLVFTYVRMFDWVLGTHDFNRGTMAKGLEQFEQDTKKSALI
jgi:hypothetical protein